MWKLINTKKEHLEKYIIVGEECIVGRKDASLMITNDPSVSRKHAILYVTHLDENVGNPSNPSSLFLRDEGSKYGTFKNGVRVTSEVELLNDDVVKFGQFESEFRISKLPLVVTTSCLDLSGKRELKKIIHCLGGHFVSEWQPNCSHLVMSEVKVTIKALCCLCSAKPIVLPNYFSDLKNNIGYSTISVLPNQYIPPIGEALIDKEMVSFDINLQRKHLFKNKNFFFLDEKQFKKLHLGILLGSGNASILSPERVTPELLLQEGCCVIEPMKESSQETRGTLQKIISILQTKKFRMIPESDVGLAVAYCSTEKFCNPEFSMGDAILRNQKVQSQTLTEREVYVPDTQERVMSAERVKNMVSQACSSLNFSTFRTEAVEEMEVSEIPMSAQVKRELDDIFDEPMDTKADTIPHVLNSLDETRKLKRECSNIQNEESSFCNQNLKPSVKKRLSVTGIHPPEKQNGLSSQKSLSPTKRNVKSEENGISGDFRNHCSPPSERNGVKSEDIHLPAVNEFIEPELPRNLVKVEVVSLVYKRQTVDPVVQQYKNSSTKNFKKFKKVYPKKAQSLPRIIGAHELVPYDKIAADICNVPWDDAEEVPQPIKGAFDWDTPTV